MHYKKKLVIIIPVYVQEPRKMNNPNVQKNNVQKIHR